MRIFAHTISRMMHQGRYDDDNWRDGDSDDDDDDDSSDTYRFVPTAGVRLFNYHVSWVMNKPEILFNLHGTPYHVAEDQFNALFMMLSKESGLDGKATSSRIDLINSNPRLASELRELFQPRLEDEMIYPEYIAGISAMASSYALRSPRIQASANIYIQKAILKAESTAGNDISYASFLPKSISISPDPAPSTVAERNPPSLFRSSSTGSEQFCGDRRYFALSDETNRLLSSCFSDLFVNESGQTSMKIDDAPVSIQHKYHQLWELFAGGDGLVRRKDLIDGMCTAAENHIKTNPDFEKICTLYAMRKAEVALKYLKNLLDDRFPVGTKVFLRVFSDWDREEIPAEIIKTEECSCQRLSCQSPILFTVRTIDDSEYRARSFEIRMPKESEEFVKKQMPGNRARVVYAKPSYDMSEEAYECDSYDLLQALRAKFGENFSCTQEHVPLVVGEDFGYFFVVDKVRHDFDFVQYDYGITFGHFLDPTWLEPSFSSERLRTSAAVHESMRCFFLHMGMAVGIHPFALQIAYRKLTKILLENPPAPEDNKEARENYCGWNGDPLASVQSRGNYVDCLALNAIWPIEFDDYQVLIVNLNASGAFNPAQGFTHIRPPNPSLIGPDGEWLGKDIVLTLQNGHFTYLKPKPECTVEDLNTKPIAVMLEYARKLEFSVSPAYFTMFPELFPTQFADEYRVSVIKTLHEFLAAERPPEPPPFVPPTGDFHSMTPHGNIPSKNIHVGTAGITSIPENVDDSERVSHTASTNVNCNKVYDDHDDVEL